MERYPPLLVKVWGPWACFTRPEAKVERVTYPVPTPSAARGMLEAILWRPEFRWRVEEIWILNPVRYFSLTRNEVTEKLNPGVVRRWPQTGGHFYVEDHRAQRHTVALRDVSYIFRAQLIPNDPAVHPAKYRDQFRRRVERGQCFSRPYLGCREFSAEFAPAEGTERPVDWTADLGRMLFDFRFEGPGRATPIYFEAKVERGVLRVPQELYGCDEEGGPCHAGGAGGAG